MHKVQSYTFPLRQEVREPHDWLRRCHTITQTTLCGYPFFPQVSWRGPFKGLTMVSIESLANQLYGCDEKLNFHANYLPFGSKMPTDLSDSLIVVNFERTFQIWIVGNFIVEEN